VDLGVVLEKCRISLWQYAGMAMELEETLKKNVGLIEIDLMHTWIKRNFDKEKLEIYHT
jgi:predicted nucleotidyltransferase